MKVNVGSADKIIRIVAGVAVISWGFYAKNWLGAIGIVPLATAAMGWCPLYSILGVKTCPMKKD
jgi:hypothetical protein